MVSWKLVTGVIAAAATLVSAAPLQKRLVSGKYFDHFMVIVLENEDYSVSLVALLYLLWNAQESL
jgi:hypothetical protein